MTGPAANAQASFSIRAVTDLEGFDRCVDLEKAVWKYTPADMIPRRIFLLASRIGGQVLAAYDGETMAGFAMALPGFRDGRPYLHSHMLGVLPAYRNAGLGRRLKLAQRDDALARGIDLMEWTFDPLEIRNAHLNISRLGVIVRRYQENFYGPSSSPLQGGLPTDRVYAEWWLASEHVEKALRGKPENVEATLTVDVPWEIYGWKASADHSARARQVQAQNAERLQRAFREGLAVAGYRRDQHGNGSFLLAPLERVADTIGLVWPSQAKSLAHAFGRKDHDED